MATVDFDAFDADNHYYEATDAFTRHLPAQYSQARAVGRDRRQAADDRRQQDLPLHPEPHVRSRRAARAASTITSAARSPATTFAKRSARSSRSIPRTASPTARVELDGRAAARGLLPVPDARRRRGRGVAARSRRAARACSTRSTSGCTTTGRSTTDERIFAAPYICLQDPARAEAEVDVRARVGRARRRDALRTGARPAFSPLARRSGLRRHVGAASRKPAFSLRTTRATRVTAATPTSGAAAATSRRSATTRSGTSPVGTVRSTTRSPRWCATACSAATRICGSRRSRAAPIGCRCCCTRSRSRTARRRARTTVSIRCSRCATTCGFRRTTRTTCPQLRDELGANKMIFGSDYPHAEGLADPLSFVNDLPGFSDDDIRLVMRENGLALVRASGVAAVTLSIHLRVRPSPVERFFPAIA